MENDQRLCECGCLRPIPRNRYVTATMECYPRYVRKPLADERSKMHGRRGGRPKPVAVS
jgi:hypothetical protein